MKKAQRVHREFGKFFKLTDKRQVARDKLTPPVYDANLVSLMRTGMESPFWAALRSIIEVNIAALEDKILDDDSLSEQIVITHRDYVRKWRNLNYELLNLPQSIIASLEEGVAQPLNLDPYARVAEILTKKSSSALE